MLASPTGSVTFHRSGWKSTPAAMLHDSGSVLVSAIHLVTVLDLWRKGQEDYNEIMQAGRGDPLHVRVVIVSCTCGKGCCHTPPPGSGGPILSSSLHCLLGWVLVCSILLPSDPDQTWITLKQALDCGYLRNESCLSLGQGICPLRSPHRWLISSW